MKESVIIQNPYALQHTPLLIVISGPSGVGKDSVVQRLKERQIPFHFVITVTSRTPRPHEVHGKDYFFVSETKFESLIAEDELLEHAIVYEQYKGIPKQQVREALASGQDVVMRLDVQGAATIRNLAPDAVLIFLSAVSENELFERLRARRTETPEQLQHRFEVAQEEMSRISEFDYVVLNRDGGLDEAVKHILAIIAAEHARVYPRQVVL